MLRSLAGVAGLTIRKKKRGFPVTRSDVVDTGIIGHAHRPADQLKNAAFLPTDAESMCPYFR